MAGQWNQNQHCTPGNVTNRFRSEKQSSSRVRSVAQMNYTGYDSNWTLASSTTTRPSGYHQASTGVQPNTCVQDKSFVYPSRYMNGCTTSTSSLQPPSQNSEPNVEVTAKHIQNIWATWKQSQVLTDTLRYFFETSSNPYSSLIKLINVISEDRIKGKASTMIHTITEEFYNWIQFNESKYEHFLTEELKIHAFKMVLEKKICINTTNIIVNIFKCKTHLSIMEELIRGSIQQKRFKEACYATISLNIQDKFTVEEFVIPLFFLNMVSVTEEFLVTSKFQQQALVKYFDNLLLQSDDCLYQLANHLNVTTVNNNFSNKGQIKTNLTRIMKKYNIPNEFAPNITKQKKKGALKFMFHRYQSGVTGIDGWREMVLESVGNDEDMMLEVVRMMDSYGDFQEGIYFAQVFSIDPLLLPPNIQQELLFSENASARSMPTEYKSFEYHELVLPDKQIHLIDCASKFDNFLNKINIELFDANLNVFGLDCEWKPELTRDKSDLASIQLATIDAIYIFHLPQLQPTESFKLHWQEFAMNIFSNVNILKLGFEWKGDASMISSTLPIDNVQLYGPGFVDIKLLWKELETKWNFELPYQNPNDDLVYNSLSDLVKLCFGKPLNKTEQFSNWEKIPLRTNQIKYAALDAYCLLEIYNLFKSKCKNSNIPFDEICYKISSKNYAETTKPKPKNRKHKNHRLPKTNMESKSPHTHISRVKDFKLLVPNTLEKLAERLRKCGIDTAVVERSKISNFEYIVNLIKTNNLHFIAFGHAFSKVAEQLRIGQCYCVQNPNLDDQLQEVLNYFKIVVKKEDLNSRCQNCNSDNYETVNSATMKHIYDKVKSIQNQPVVKYRPPIDEEDYDDYYNGGDDDDSDDEGMSAPIKKQSTTPIVFKFTQSDEKNTHGILLSGYTNENLEINVKPLSADMFNDKSRSFNICNSCGSVSWDNSHWESALGSSVGLKYK